MAVNELTQITAQLVTELGALSTNYANLYVARGLFRPAKLPVLDRYAIIVAPTGQPWQEKRNTVASLQFIYRLDLYLLVRNWTEGTDEPLFGTTAGSLGLFQMVWDVKELLRISDLNGLLDKTYDEPGGDPSRLGGGGIDFEDLISGFDAGEHPMWHRARMPYLARGQSFCYPRP